MSWDRLFIWVFCLTTCQARKLEPSETPWIWFSGLSQTPFALSIHGSSYPFGFIVRLSANAKINQDQTGQLGLAYFLSKPNMLTSLFFRVTKMNPLRQIAKCLRFGVKAGSSFRLVQNQTCWLMSIILGYKK